MFLKKFDDEENERPKLTKEQYRKINESLIQRNPTLGRIDESVIYDKEFLLEVQAKGYSPLDKEDIQNYLEGRAPKDLERNLKLCGADRYLSMGQSEFDEDALQKFGEHTSIKPVIKKPEDIYLSDIPSKKAKDFLLESDEDTEQMIKQSQSRELNESDKHVESEDEYRKNLAKVFGSEEFYPKKSLPDSLSKSTEIIKKDERTEKILELIKELRALGFTPEEIKKEIQRFHVG